MKTFLSTIAGALVSLFGVWLTLRHNQKVHEENLRAEREKRREEREFSAKQGSLLSAAEAVTRFLSYYMTLADRTLPQDGSVADEITEMNVALNRIHFHCSLETIEKSTKLSQVLGEVFAEAMKAKMPSAFVVEELKSIDVQITSFEKSNEVIQSEINSLLLSDSLSPLIITHRGQLSRNFETISNLHQKKVELIKERYIETEKCRDVISNNLRFIYEASRDVLLIARKELSFPINEERYSKIMDDRITSTEKKLEELFSEVRNEVTKRMI